MAHGGGTGGSFGFADGGAPERGPGHEEHGGCDLQAGRCRVIEFDPKNIIAATALIEVDMASLDLGDPAYNAELRKKSWFDSATYPRAVFKSTAIKAVSATRFDATGTLTVKGRVLTITVPVTTSSTTAGTAFDGTFVMSRKAFGIGDPIWEDAVEDKVSVKFHLVGGK
jgi:polyisoprenoid-binding protein YceI